MKHFFNGIALAAACFVLALAYSGDPWQPVAVLAIVCAVVANGSHCKLCEPPEEVEPVRYPPRVSAAPGDRWWEETDSLPVLVSTDTQPMSRRALKERA